jgi:hypothetical protein
MQAVLYGVWPVVAAGCGVAALYHHIRLRAVGKFLKPGADFTRLKRIHRFSSPGKSLHVLRGQQGDGLISGLVVIALL